MASGKQHKITLQVFHGDMEPVCTEVMVNDSHLCFSDDGHIRLHYEGQIYRPVLRQAAVEAATVWTRDAAKTEAYTGPPLQSRYENEWWVPPGNPRLDPNPWADSPPTN